MTSRRSQILNAKRSVEMVVLPLESGDVKVEVRERNVAQQFDLLEKARRPDGSIDTKLSGVEGIIACCFDPDTGDPLFTDADRDYILEEMPASLYWILSRAVNKAAGFTTEEEEVADLKETPPDATSTS